jgi:S1-C subfamily serine protease
LKSLFVLVLSLFLFGCNISCATFTKNLASNQLEPDYYSHIVRLNAKVLKNPEVSLQATGFAISRNLIMTAGHFCATAEIGMAMGVLGSGVHYSYMDDQNIEESSDLIIVNYVMDEVNNQDICILKKKNHGIKPVEFAKLSSIDIGDKLTIVGAPLGVFPTKTEGHVTLLDGGETLSYLKNYLVTSVPSYGGNSGSPIFDEEGKVVGMLVAGHPAYPHITLGIRVDALKDFIKKTK